MMKKEESTTMENSIYGSRNISPSETLMYSDLMGGGGGGVYVNQSSMFDNYMVNSGINEEELGFLEMLGVQEFQLPIGYRFEEMLEREMLLPCTKTEYHQHHQVASVLGERNSNAPGTPNSSSISSASNNEGVAVESEHEKAEEDDDEEEEEEKDHEGSDKSKKLLKAKKPNLKKQRQPRFAFMTKSEVDHLEDGYRWRKYGQKAVKNSPFPRSYYRCTSVSCGVKKRVERSCTDPSVVVTTYEGQHTHPSPLTPRGLSAAIFQDSRAFSATMPTLMQMNNIHSHYQQQQQQQQQQQLLLQSSYFASHFNHNSYPTTNTTLTTLLSDQAPSFNSFTPSIHNVNVSNLNQGFSRDHGLLQDLIPSLVPKEESDVNL